MSDGTPSPLPPLRPYQEAALEAVRTRKVQRGILALPTGTGKTLTASQFPRILGTDRILVLAHREELIAQLVGAFATTLGHHRVGVERAEYRAPDTAPCVVASTPTLAAVGGRRLHQLDPGRFDVIVLDEAHHGTSESHLAVWRHFGLLDGENKKTTDPRVLLLGLTATPGRGDGVGLEAVFDSILFQYRLIDAIRDGWLVPIEAYTVETGTDLSAVRTRAGEFVESELAAAVNTDDRNRVVLDAWEKHAKGLRTVAFCVDLAHSRSVTDGFRARGIEATSIDGTMESSERGRILAWFRGTPGAVLVNVAILSEGTDIPGIECVLKCAPTKSATRYAQELGRGLRLAPGARDITESVILGKHRCVLLDVTDSTSRVGARAVRIGDLVGLPLKDKVLKGENVLDELARQEEEQARPKEASGPQRAAPVATKRVDLFALTTEPPAYADLQWLVTETEWHLPIGRGERVRLTQDMLGMWTAHWWDDDAKAWLAAHAAPAPDPRPLVELAETWVAEHRPEQRRLLARAAVWRHDPPSDKQLALCRRKGIPVPVNATKGDVSRALDVFFGRAQ